MNLSGWMLCILYFKTLSEKWLITLQAYLGIDSNGIPMHGTAEGGFTGSEAPNPISANDGRIFVQFQTNAIDSRIGWRATYSNSMCGLLVVCFKRGPSVKR